MNFYSSDYSKNEMKRYSMSSDSNTQQNKYRPLVIVLAGPTAVGKSDVAAALCSHSIATEIMVRHQQNHWSKSSNESEKSSNDSDNRLETRGHVVSADSVQVYRGVSIGANKPSREEMERTPHHLVDIVDPPDHDIAGEDEDVKSSMNGTVKVSSYNAADWMRDAEYVIQKLTLHECNGGFDADEGDQHENIGAKNEEIVRRRKCIDDYFNESYRNEGRATSRTPILPVVVGGTMFYLNWLVHGRPDAVRPTEEALKRAAGMITKFKKDSDIYSSVKCVEGGHNQVDEINAGSMKPGNTIEEEANVEQETADERSWTNASKYVSSLGPVFASRVTKLCGRDWYRLRRLLEVAYTVAFSKMQSESFESLGDENDEARILSNLTENEVYTGIRSGGLPDLGYDVRCFFLCPDDRMLHFHAVDQRCEEMLLKGLLRETADLFVSGGLPEDSQVTRAIGYRQSMDYLLRKDAKMNDRDSFLSFVDNFATATRQYAKKQMQWFRRDSEFAFIPVKMEWSKNDRVKDAASRIADMCKLSREDFVAQLTFDIGDIISNEAETTLANVQLPIPARTRLANEQQGKGMKFFISKRELLIEGSTELRDTLAEADKYTMIVQGH